MGTAKVRGLPSPAGKVNAPRVVAKSHRSDARPEAVRQSTADPDTVAHPNTVADANTRFVGAV